MMRHGKNPSSWQDIVDVLLNVFAALILLTVAGLVVLPMLARENPRRPRAFCQNNLKQIAIALQLYRQENNDVWPLTLSELYPEYVEDLNVFICADSADKVGAPGAISMWTSYKYTPYDGSPDPAIAIVCRDKKSFHEPGWKNLLFADGHVSGKRDRESAEK